MSTDQIMALTRDTAREKRRRRSLRYTVIIERGREAGYVAICPALPGCISQGRTTSETRRNIREAIEAYIEALLDDGLRVPIETGRETVEIRIAAR
ncbi:MAG TPA: type II toxin-antitoxin system HicB family antitoxin [Methylomirabilota bacterium]|nr:type II toxin-antitoxin system HicB family antitoxin [Methylomirabilota bacterium]